MRRQEGVEAARGTGGGRLLPSQMRIQNGDAEPLIVRRRRGNTDDGDEPGWFDTLSTPLLLCETKSERS